MVSTAVAALAAVCLREFDQVDQNAPENQAKAILIAALATPENRKVELQNITNQFLPQLLNKKENGSNLLVAEEAAPLSNVASM